MAMANAAQKTNFDGELPEDKNRFFSEDIVLFRVGFDLKRVLFPLQ